MIFADAIDVPLVRLLYTSHSVIDATTPEGNAEIARIIERSARNNAARGVTGALLFVRNTFIQALEGPIAAVEGVFESICRDLRHSHVHLVELAPSDTRMFGQWSMARIGGDGTSIALDHAMDDVYQSLSVSPSFALRKMRQLLSEGVLDAA